MIAQNQTLTAFRQDPLQIAMRVNGYDLTGATFKLSVRLYPDAAGDPLIEVEGTPTPGANGIRIADTGTTDGVPWTDLDILIGKALLSDSSIPAAEEAGDDIILAYDFGWTRASSSTAFVAVEETILFGDFIVKGSVND